MAVLAFQGKHKAVASADCHGNCVALNKDQISPNTLTVKLGDYVQFNSADGLRHNLGLGDGEGDLHSHEHVDDGKAETIRLIGVDTPETKDPRKKVQCFGQAAADFTSSTLLGNTVRLASDSSQQNRDKYGRLLRYVYLNDGTNFNEKLIKEGFAYEYTYAVPYQYQPVFKDDQAAASAAGKGLWAANTCAGKR